VQVDALRVEGVVSRCQWDFSRLPPARLVVSP
jgi:hypothetical protein